jgi:hypothetical protein
MDPLDIIVVVLATILATRLVGILVVIMIVVGLAVHIIVMHIIVIHTHVAALVFVIIRIEIVDIINVDGSGALEVNLFQEEVIQIHMHLPLLLLHLFKEMF